MGTPDQVELLLLDVDGVLTDGSIWYDDAGQELKRFHVRDGTGIKAWISLGFHIGIVTGRGGPTVRHRMRDLGVTQIESRVRDKLAAARAIASRVGVPLDKAACLGDDWPDLSMMRGVAYPMAVADADAIVRKHAAWVTDTPGGQGAAREAIEHLLRARGLLDRARQAF